MADFGHFDGFQPPLSSALFYIRLVIRDFSKTAEDRSSADTAISIHVAILPVPTGKVYRFPTNSGHFLPANPHTPLIPLTALEAGGRKDQILPSCAEGGKPFLPACLHATPSPAASCTGVHLRNVRAYILFDVLGVSLRIIILRYAVIVPGQSRPSEMRRVMVRRSGSMSRSRSS